MIDRALANLFKVVTDEAATNPGFARKVEDQIAKFGQELAEKRLAERVVEAFHPLVEYRKTTPEAFEARLAKFSVAELRALIARHNLDPSGMLKGKGAKKALAAHIVEAARKRAERDARLFEY